MRSLSLSPVDEALSDGFSPTFKPPKQEEKPVEPLVQLAGPPPEGEPKPPVATAPKDPSGMRAAGEAQLAAEAQARRVQELKSAQAKGETAAKEAREAAVYAEYKPRLTAPYETFKPTGDTASSLASLGLMIGMLGAMGGKKGLTSATGAMNAIAGMMTGYQQGSKEKYDKERQIFEENLKIAQQNHALVEKEFERAVKYAKYDLTGATNSLIKSRLAAGDPTGAKVLQDNGLVAYGSQLIQAGGKINGEIKKETDRMIALQETAKRAQIEVEARKAEKPTGTSQRPYTSQDETGQLVLRMPGTNEIVVDDQGKPIRPATAAMVTAASKGAGGEASPNSLQFRYNNAVAGASYRLAASISNIIELPTFASSPGLSEMIADPAKGLTGSAERYLAQKTTSVENRAWQQQAARIKRAAGAIEAGGRPGGVTASAMNELANELEKPNDAKINKVLALALIKQELDFAEKELKVSGASKDQIQLAVDSKNMIEEKVPFTVSDINRILRGGKSPLSNSINKNLLDSVSSTKEFDKRVKILERVKNIPIDAREMLLASPTQEARKQFDEIFGKDASFAVIGK
jgi:hypothetical protein